MEICKKELCNGCTACANICPKSCITMVADEEGFLRPSVDESLCVNCGRCGKICSVVNFGTVENIKTTAYCAINKNDEARKNSTSGGVFTLVSQWVFNQNGVVFGARYNESFDVVHTRIESLSELSLLRGAKYSQSRLDDCFVQVKSALEEEKYVLFSGTPCQIGGLVSFLGKEYEKLILVDLICHGVPSPKVWRHYVEYRCKRDNDGELPANINLRSKESGWPSYSIRFEYGVDKIYSELNFKDPFLRGFVGNFYLRPSCYDCRFKSISRVSDFTLGDFWGVWSQMPQMNDGKGTSLVFLHSEKARSLWNQISNGLQFLEVDPDESIKENPSAIVSSSLPKRRKEFFDRYEKEDFLTLIDELRPIPNPSAFKNRVRQFLGRVKRKILSLIK